MKLLVAALLAACALGACTLFDDDPPGDTCTSDQECFRAQGERCNQQTHVCELTPDAGVDAP